MISDAWTSKTHDLIYKPQGEIGEIFKRQMAIIGDQLQQIDKQSEIIKDAIAKAWRDDSRRQAVCFVHGAYLRSKEENEDINRIVEIVESSIKIDRDISDQDLAESLRIVESLTKQEKYEAVARLKLMLAIVSPQVTVDQVIEAIQRWLVGISVGDKVEEARAWLLQSIAHFSFGGVEEAIEAIEQFLEGDVCLPSGILARAYQNLAYFYTDIMHAKRGKDFRARENASTYLAKAKCAVDSIPDDEEEDRLRMQSRVKETEGYFIIMDGDSERKIKDGLQICRQALDESIEKDVAQRYFDVHERIAWRRIFEVTVKDS